MPKTPAAQAPQGPTEAELRDIIQRGEALRQQLAALEQQRDLAMELAGEARRALSTLDHLATAKDGDEMLVPLGAGAFVHAKLAASGSALANLGSGVHALTPMADARDRLKARAENLESATQQLSKDMERVIDELARVNAVVEAYYGA